MNSVVVYNHLGMSRRRPRYITPGRRAGSVLLAGGRAGARRKRRRPPRRRRGIGRGRVWGVVALVIVLAAAAGAFLLLRSHRDAQRDRRAAVLRFTTAWERTDTAAMWRALTPHARAANPEARFVAAYRKTARVAGVRTVRVGRVAIEHAGALAAPVAVVTRDFGTLAGTLRIPVSGAAGSAGVDWSSTLMLPGLRPGEAVRKRAGAPPTRASILAADGTSLDATGLGAAIAGQPGQAGQKATGLQGLYDDRLAGHPSERLLFGAREVARVPAVHGHTLHTTLRPGLMASAAAALGGKLGGVAVVRPRDGAILALAGLAVSGPQPPGSTFKIITVSAALKYGVATPTTSFPVRTFATLSGVKLGNARGEACGGTLTQAFTESCNSVFAPLGAKIGARHLVATARAFGFGEQPKVPSARPSSISPASGLRDDLAVGAAAIGQDRDLATPLEMASAGATIALEGRRARPRIATADPVSHRRVISPHVAHQVRAMMLDVVASGTGTAARIAGVQVAGKTGTAELRPNSKDPKDADAWFVAFAPARHPQIAVGVLLVGAGFGGTAAAPIARKVLLAGLGG